VGGGTACVGAEGTKRGVATQQVANKLLVYEALATRVRGLKLLLYEAFS
jgi:hypothetical protein